MSYRALTEEQEQEIVSLYKSGVSMRRLYYEHGYTTSVVNRILKKYRVRKSKVGYSKERKQKEAQKTVAATGEQPAIDCDKQGKKCIYRMNARTTELYRCNYCLTTGRMRGGDPHSCTKYSLR